MPTAQQRAEHVEGGPKVIDGYLTTGSSPGEVATVHVLGLGSVGRAIVDRLPINLFRIVGLSDRSGTLIPSSHGDALRAARRKAEGISLGSSSAALTIPLPEVLSKSPADIVVDATHTDLDREGWHNFLQQNVLLPGRGLVFASKDGLCRRGPAWGEEFGFERLRFNAVLGGTGKAFASDLPRLRSQVRGCAIAGNASTTAIIETMEQGGNLEDGITEAGRLGLLESDPELDLCGADAAIKIAIVVGLLTGRPIDPDSIVKADVRDLSVDVVRRRRTRGCTTRLVGRYGAGGRPLLRFEELQLGHPLAVARDEVTYRYQLGTGECIEHRGTGLGAKATADAVISDLFAVAPSAVQAGGVR